MEIKTVLGLSVNTRMIAMAIIQGTTLEHYQISLRKGSWSTQKKDLILARLHSLLTTYTITHVALALPYENHTTEHIENLLESLKTYFDEYNIPVCLYCPQAFHLLCEESASKTKKALMQTVSELYPELEVLYQKEMRNKNKYYIKLFEAVALATIHSQSLWNRHIEQKEQGR